MIAVARIIGVSKRQFIKRSAATLPPEVVPEEVRHWPTEQDLAKR